MHAIVEEGEIVHIIEKSYDDYNQGKTVVQKKPKFLRSMETAKIVVRMKKPVCIEKYENVAELG